MPQQGYQGPLEEVNDYCYRIPRSYQTGMRVGRLIFADDQLVSQIAKDQAPDQVANVATVPEPTCSVTFIMPVRRADACPAPYSIL